MVTANKKHNVYVVTEMRHRKLMVTASMTSLRRVIVETWVVTDVTEMRNRRAMETTSVTLTNRFIEETL